MLFVRIWLKIAAHKSQQFNLEFRPLFKNLKELLLTKLY